MVHLYTPSNILQTIGFAVLTFFIAPYILVEKTGLFLFFPDPCMAAFIAGFIVSLIVWNVYTKHQVY